MEYVLFQQLVTLTYSGSFKMGSKGTGMMGFKTLKGEQIWQLVLYLRKFSS